MELPPFFYFPSLHCNLLNLSYLPFLFCAIALQSIKLELPPFFLFCTIALQSIKLELPPFFLCARLHWNLLNWSYLPFLFCAIALQSIKLELPLFFILRDCIAIF